VSSSPEASGPALEAVRRALGVSLYDTWMGYFEVGGDGSLADVRSWLGDGAPLSSRNHDLIAQSLNDFAIEIGSEQRAPYRGIDLSR
jgi:hypothetical protein